MLGNQAGDAETTTFADRRSLSMYRNDLVSNNSCPVCGGDHNVLMISLENGGHIVTRPFPKEKASKVKKTDAKRRATKLDLVDIFWQSEEGGI